MTDHIELINRAKSYVIAIERGIPLDYHDSNSYSGNPVAGMMRLLIEVVEELSQQLKNAEEDEFIDSISRHSRR